MKAYLLLITCLVALTSGKVYSQVFEVPEHYDFKVAADYKAHEKNVIDAANWLKSVPLNEQKPQRKKVSAFVLLWINGSPTVMVEITPIIMNFEDKNNGMLVLFMALSAKYVLENEYSKDMRAKHKYALREMMAVYNLGVGIKKDKRMDKLIKSDSDGKLDEWLSEIMYGETN